MQVIPQVVCARRKHPYQPMGWAGVSGSTRLYLHRAGCLYTNVHKYNSCCLCSFYVVFYVMHNAATNHYSETIPFPVSNSNVNFFEVVFKVRVVIQYFQILVSCYCLGPDSYWFGFLYFGLTWLCVHNTSELVPSSSDVQ